MGCILERGGAVCSVVQMVVVLTHGTLALRLMQGVCCGGMNCVVVAYSTCARTWGGCGCQRGARAGEEGGVDDRCGRGGEKNQMPRVVSGMTKWKLCQARVWSWLEGAPPW